MLVEQIQGRLRPHAPSLVPGVVVVGVMLFWAIHNGGYDPGTWYWGALLFLGMLAAMLALGLTRTPLPRAAAPALTLFGLYVAWSYLSISWAQSPGDALQGSNRALLYLLILAVMLLIPWTPGAALGALLLYTLGIGVVAVVLLARLASADHVGSLFVAGRLASPTGYLNSTAALFMIDALTATALAARRELPGLLRGVLIAIACASLQLTLIVESRGWLFTLPVVVLVALAIVPDRLRVAAAAAVPIAAALGLLHRLLDVYRANPGTELNHAASAAGRAALIVCAVALVLGCLIGWIEELRKPRRLPRRTRRAAGSVVVLLAVVAVIAGGTAATHGDPLGFLSRQWHGFAHPQVSSSLARTSPMSVAAATTSGESRSTPCCAPGRRAWSGQLRGLLHHPAPHRRGAELDAQPRTAAAGPHRIRRLCAVRRVHGRGDRGRAAGAPTRTGDHPDAAIAGSGADAADRVGRPRVG